MRYAWRFAFALAIGLSGCGKNEGGARKAASTGGDGNSAGPATCQRDKATSKVILKVAVIPKGTTHEFWKSIHAGAIKAEQELKDVSVEWKGPVREDDRAEQINVVDNFINMGVDGIVIAPTDDTALVTSIRTAIKAGIGVVIADSGTKADPCTDYASFVATDSYIGGQKGARRLGDVLGKKGKVLMMRYQIGSASTALREQGFLDVMAKEFPEIQLVSTDQYAGATSESAQKKADSLLQRFAELDGIYCPNESSTFGMLRSLEEAGRAGKLKFVGFDSSPKLIEALAGGKIQGLVLQDPLNMGYLAVKTMVDYLRGRRVDTRIDTGSDVATPENMNEPRMKDLLSPPFATYLKG